MRPTDKIPNSVTSKTFTWVCNNMETSLRNNNPHILLDRQLEHSTDLRHFKMPYPLWLVTGDFVFMRAKAKEQFNVLTIGSLHKSTGAVCSMWRRFTTEKESVSKQKTEKENGNEN
jgi:hypothetical protein